LSQLPENIRNCFLDTETMYVKQIMVHHWDDQESFMYEGIPTNKPPESHGEYYSIKLNSNAPGYVLTALLNMDFEVVTDLVASLEWDETADEYHDPPVNYKEIHSKLLAVSDVFSFYLPNEWNLWQYDLASMVEGVGGTVALLRKYIDFCNRRQIPYTGQFFTFLLSNGYFLVDPSVIMPMDDAVHYDNLFDDGGELIDELDEIYETFMQGFDPRSAGSNCYILWSEDRLRDLAVVSFYDLTNRGKIIRKCQNCGKYFIPAKRSDTLYCDNPSPEAPEMTCKEYGTRRLWYERQKTDEIATLSRKIASAKGMLAKRNPDLLEYAASYEYFKAQRLAWIKAVKEGTKTQDEYRGWLLYMQNQKIIKEAVHGID
ncbi:MAG: hypothetical protein IJY91_06330, partial [Oscillospiraceae bacterium]|nr:hypothetical protein [Oscillospiraceae bacterium]